MTRAALLSTFCADQESRWLAGDDTVDMAAWLSAIDRQRRTLMALGLERRAKHVTTLGDLWRREHAEILAAAEREMAAKSEEQPQ